ncbi:DegT/DnrJ/EryC1/StrS family aminotransferase [Aureimonas populi]|uniref:DegT/DnrJ/EryC1/StrS family aminotransferase n=1 Tax=Aureimonas populi TaxID=1701758 RepID=A0ABW5CIJ4_9HYPH|nr:DegT/DnrJ/EryC1/StrS aminotransferase family protein [Aureimonas populi]
MSQSPIAFIDLAAQQAVIRERVEARLKRVLDHGAYIMGPEIAELEERLGAFAGLPHTLACSSGTDALLLPLMAWGVGPGDAVFCPSFTFAATAEVVAFLGATPVFVDVLPDTFNMDAAGLARAVEAVKREGRLVPRAVIAVDLFGQIADYPSIRRTCDAHGLKLISDAAQGYGSTLDGQQSGVWADVVCTSFFPAKPLGCYGDGGAVQTHDGALHAVMASLRIHGQGADKYDNVRIGMNGRIDTMQAAILLEKLDIFAGEIEARGRIAARYGRLLSGLAVPQALPTGVVSTFAQYTVLVDGGRRDALAGELKARGVPTAIYYPKPLHRQTAYRDFPVEGGRLPVSDKLGEQVISLPMHPYLDAATQDFIVSALREALEKIGVAAA